MSELVVGNELARWIVGLCMGVLSDLAAAVVAFAAAAGGGGSGGVETELDAGHWEFLMSACWQAVWDFANTC